MDQGGIVRRKPPRPDGPRCSIPTGFFPVKEHADPLLRSVTACHPAACSACPSNHRHGVTFLYHGSSFPPAIGKFVGRYGQ
jgi:hypothetical protein